MTLFRFTGCNLFLNTVFVDFAIGLAGINKPEFGTGNLAGRKES